MQKIPGTRAENPWLTRPDMHDPAPDESLPLLAPHGRPTGPTTPQEGVVAPDRVDRLPSRPLDTGHRLVVVGAHGGAGESTLAALDPGWAAGGQAWPEPAAGATVPVIVVCRTHGAGLNAARLAAQQWASGAVPSVDLLGLAAIDDAPGRLPKPLRDLLKVAAGGYPRLWRIPWSEAWRTGTDDPLSVAPREARQMLRAINQLTTV
jgi:hypothetical protein